MGHWEEEGDSEIWYYDENEMLQQAIGNYGTTYDFEDWVRNTYTLDEIIEKAVEYDDPDEVWNGFAKEYEDSLLQEAGPAVKGQDYCIYDVNFIWNDDDDNDDE